MYLKLSLFLVLELTLFKIHVAAALGAIDQSYTIARGIFECMMKMVTCIHKRWKKSVLLICGRLGVRIPAASDLCSDSSTAKRSATGVSVTGPR